LIKRLLQSSGIYWSLSIIFLKQLIHQFFLANIADLQEMFEREIGRLRTLFPQQQQQQQHVAFGSLSFTELAAPFIPLLVVVSSIKRGAALMNREFHPIVKKAGEVNNCGSGP